MLVSYPLFLLALLALAIPLVLHFWGIRMYKKVYMSSIALLQKVKIETNTTQHIKRLLLLLARLSLLAFLVLAFAQPFWKDEVPLVHTGAGASVAVLDNSGSMCSRRDQTLFFEMQEWVAKLNAKEERAAGSTTACAQNAPKLRDYWIQADPRKDLYVFSDFQKSFVDLKDLKPKAKTVFLVACEQNDKEANVSVDSVWLSGNFVRSQSATQVYVQLRNNSPIDNNQVLVELKVGGKAVASNMVAVPARSTVKLPFSVLLQQTQDRFCELRIDDANWTFDNNFYFVLNPIDRLGVALLSDLQVPKHPVKVAFDQEPVFVTKTFCNLAGMAAEAAETSLLVFNRLGEVGESEFARLAEMAKEGKSVVIVPSETWGKPEADKLTRALGGIPIEAINQAPIEMEVPAQDQPFFRNMFEQLPQATNMPSIKPVWKLPRASESLLRAKNGETALAAYEVGKGKMYVFSFFFGEGETFTKNAMFLPVFYRMAENSAKNSMRPYSRITDESVAFSPKESAQKDEVYVLESGSLQVIPEQRREGEKVRLFLPLEQMALGIWKVKNKAGQDLVQFGLNNDRRESQVDFYSVEELKEMFAAQPKVRVLSLDEFKKQTRQWTGQGGAWPLWRYAIVISFLFLLGEILIARFYTHNLFRVKKLQP